MNPRAEERSNLLLWVLAACGAVIFAAGLIGLVEVRRTLDASRRSLVDRARVYGRTAAARVNASGSAANLGLLFPLSARPSPTPRGKLIFKGAALVKEGKVLWVEPGLTLPEPLANQPAGEGVKVLGAGFAYFTTLRDGRVLVLSFQAPAYARLRARYTLFLGMAVFFGVLLLLLLFWLGLKTARKREGLLQTMREAQSLLPKDGGSDPTGTLMALFQRTLGELRARTKELEALHSEERKRAEDVEEMAQAICANLEAGYLRFDLEDRLTAVNAAGRTLLGLTEVPRIGDEAQRLLSGKPEVLSILEEVRQSGALVVRDEVPGASGTFLQAVGLPLYNLLHQLRGNLLILKDQTDLYAMRRALREREALTRLGEVAAGVAHEVRNALSTLSANLGLLVQDNSSLADNAHFKALKEESEKLDQVVNNLLFFARPLPRTRETFPLADLLREEGEALGSAFPGLAVEVNCPGSLTVNADYDSLQRAVRNLARNGAEAALSARSGEGKIRLEGRREGSMALCLVEDNGPGLTEEAARTLFTPFASEKPDGTGLGLAIARKIAREHGGDLEPCPSALGGACFKLSLPGPPGD